MSVLQKLLGDLAQESGAIEAPVTVQDVIENELAHSQSEGVVDKMEHASKAEAIAEQLDDLADRAEELADEDKAYANNEVAVESLHREYLAIMRANGLTFRAHSFEAEVSIPGRLSGIAKDARRTADVSRQYADSLRDFSPEGAIMQYLRGDEQRLVQASRALEISAKKLLSNKEVMGKEWVIKNDGIARFVTVEDKPTKDLGKEIKYNVEWLSDTSKRIEENLKALAIAISDRNAEKPAKLPDFKIKSIATKKGELLGNHTVTIDGKYKDEFTPQVWNAVKSTLYGGLVGFGTLVGTAIVAGFLPIGLPAAVAISYGAAGYNGTKKGIENYKENAEASSLKSIASNDDLVNAGLRLSKMAEEIRGSLELPAGLEEELKSVKSSDPQFVKQAKEILSDLVTAHNVVYEHTIYLATSLASIYDRVSSQA